MVVVGWGGGQGGGVGGRRGDNQEAINLLYLLSMYYFFVL